MKRTLALTPAAAAVVALAMTPAMAKSKKHRADGYNYYEQHFGAGSSKYLYGLGLTTRNVSGRGFSDPSYNSGARFRANNPNRCTEDLGYGRYEYCGW